jgi:predicted tellurium resistance membrane protein TerC
MDQLFTSQGIVSLLTLTFLEIVLGIDNIVFISLTTGRLPAKDQAKGRTTGLLLALGGRIALLLGVSWIISLQNPVFTFNDFEISYRDMILIAGGLFLIGKSTSEIHARIEGAGEKPKQTKALTLRAAIIQIVALDLIFSLDSILTAVGLVDHVSIIIIAIVLSLGVMIAFSGKISDFINKHPAMKLLALAFLIMIGTVLVVEGLHVHVPKGYIYFAMAFALIIEMLNMKIRKKEKRVGDLSGKP